MKKAVTLLLAVLLAFALCACGGDKPAEDNGTTTTTTAVDGDTATTTTATTTEAQTDFTYEDENVFNDAELPWD